MTKIKNNIIEYDNYIDIVGKLAFELTTQLGYDYNYQTVELEQVERLFREYYNKLKDNSEVVESNLLDTKEDYINHYNKCIKQKENEIEEFKKLILSLGKSEVESQERLIDLTVENLKKLTVESKEDIKNKGNLYKKLITFSGICIGIILI